MKRRRNPRSGDLLWGYGTSALGELRSAGADLSLPLIVKVQELEDSGQYGVVSMYDGESTTTIVAVVGHDGDAVVMNDSDGVYELAEKLLSLARTGKLSSKMVAPLKRALSSRKTEARMFAKRAGAKLRHGTGPGSVEYEALNRMYAADVAELIAKGMAKDAGWV